VDKRLLISVHDFFLACPNGGFFIFPQKRSCSYRPMSPRCLSTACDKRSVAHKAWRTARHIVRGAVLDVMHTRAKFLAVHDGMIDLLERGGFVRERVTVLPNPVRAWLDERCLAEFNSDILFVGRLEADKGIHVLAEAARQVGCRLRVIGDGPLRTMLSADYPEIDFLGRLDRQGIAKAARNARMVALPTLVRETYGLVAMEALASGIPVVISATACIGKEVAGAGMGVLCEAGSVESLAGNLRTLAADDSAVAAMSQAAYDRAPSLILSHADWCNKLIDIYCETLFDGQKTELLTPNKFAIERPLPLPRLGS
jgi:glycosyltransferase involved in cell wall biosynthesis